jgi:hypothetical protein
LPFVVLGRGSGKRTASRARRRAKRRSQRSRGTNSSPASGAPSVRALRPSPGTQLGHRVGLDGDEQLALLRRPVRLSHESPAQGCLRAPRSPTLPPMQRVVGPGSLRAKLKVGTSGTSSPRRPLQLRFEHALRGSIAPTHARSLRTQWSPKRGERGFSRRPANLTRAPYPAGGRTRAPASAVSGDRGSRCDESRRASRSFPAASPGRAARSSEGRSRFFDRRSASRSFSPRFVPACRASRSFRARLVPGRSASRSFSARLVPGCSASRSFPDGEAPGCSASRSFPARSAPGCSASRSGRTIDLPTRCA